VLVVLTTNDRRGAEIEGTRLALQLREQAVDAEVIALAPGVGTRALDVAVLGSTALAPSTLRSLRARARQFDVVIAYGSTSLPACALALFGTSIPFVYRSIGDPSAWVRGRIHRWRTGILMRRAAVVVSLWPDAAESIQQLYSIDVSRVSVIPNARSSDEFRPPTEVERVEARTLLGVPVDAQVVGWVGSISAEKRLGLAVDAVAGLQSVHLLVVGDGPRRDELEREARRALADRVTFTGTLDDVMPAYHAIDVLLLTSSTEGMPGVVLEAALCGIHVVAADVGAVSRTIDLGVRGTLVDRDATAAVFAAAVADALLNPPDGESTLAGTSTLDEVFGTRTTAQQWWGIIEAVSVSQALSCRRGAHVDKRAAT
jgi:glycosyltransferase involved in cell wall biosynthesis